MVNNTGAKKKVVTVGRRSLNNIERKKMKKVKKRKEKKKVKQNND